MSTVNVGEQAGTLVGRDLQLAQLTGWLERLGTGERPTILVSGEAGIGKTSLVRAVVAGAADRGARVAWGTCLDAGGVPGFWPWTQALNALARDLGPDAAARAAGDSAPLLASIITGLGAPSPAATSTRDRLLLLDAVGRFLDAATERGPVVVVLDDLQWADESSLALFDFLARTPRPGPVALVTTYRQDELSPSVRARLGDLATRAEHLHLVGLDETSVGALVERLTGSPVDAAQAALIHGRTGGHPFFVRELALLASHGSGHVEIPAAVRDAVNRRFDRLAGVTLEMLEVLALLGGDLLPDVVAAVVGATVADVQGAAEEAVRAGILTRRKSGVTFAHDLLREAVDARVVEPRRTELHQAIGGALEERHARGGQVRAADIARHLVAAIHLDGPDRATRWAMAAAEADVAALAFVEAADQLRRLRAALLNAAVAVDDGRLVDVLVAEAGAQARAGKPVEARGLLRHAADLADRRRDEVRVAQVALATAALGAQFSTRRDDIVRQLDHARSLVEGVDDVWEARVAATLARELQHSVAEDRPRAGPLSEHALDVGRRAGDAGTLLTCLFARHDVLWTPGAADQRAEVAQEIVAVAQSLGDEERSADGLLLFANALLEQGSAAYQAPLEAALSIFAELGQPQHRYTVATRRACVALIQGRLDEAEELIDSATLLGERIREPDTGNVRMSQRLELVRARGRIDELRAFAREAIEHWRGAPVHAHGVAAGFLARAGELDDARHHVDAVVDLGTWRADRSYLWSVFVRELAQAAVATGDASLATQLLEDIAPVASGCGVNGALVAFAGSHAHTAGLLAASLGDNASSRAWFTAAADTYRRLGAAGWLAELSGPQLTASWSSSDSTVGRPAATAATATMRRIGTLWHITFAGRDLAVPSSKGLADIARLLARPDVDVHVLDLVDARDRSGPAGAVVDRRTLDAYRQRLADLDDDVADAERQDDTERRARAESERAAIIAELRRVTRVGGQSRGFSNHPAERARKAVSGRIRDAIRKLRPDHPELADHLERSILTGNYCRYRTEEVRWSVDQPGG
jgi:hypothetical protein